MEQNDTINNAIEAPKRPTFLTVLCILTFIGSALGIFNGITSAFMSKAVGGNIENAKTMVMDSMSSAFGTDSTLSAEDKLGQDIAKNMMNNVLGGITQESIRNVGIATIISSIITLLGALMMWGLRKMGFWIYVLGVLIAIIAPIAIYGMGNLMGALSAIGTGFIGIIFIILYAVNRKHLVN